MKQWKSLFALPLLGFCLFTGCSNTTRNGLAAPPNPPPVTDNGSTPLPSPNPQNERDLALFLPNPQITPGDVLEVTREDICVPGYSKKVRNVPQSVKKQAYANYGITHHEKGEYEVDHLISLELGGSNSLKNLWPQSYKTHPWNAYLKDKLENRLHKMICEGQIDIKTAQQEIATDWIAAYKKYIGPAPQATGGAEEDRSPDSMPDMDGSDNGGSEPAPGGSGQVWVNTQSGAYWQPGTRYYGKTKEGKYMREQEAIREGYHPAGKSH